MSLNDVLTWAPIVASAIAGGGLVIAAINLWKSRKTEEIRLTEGILNDIRDLDDKEENEKDKLEWGRKFFNTIEWLSFLINNNHITDKKLLAFFKPTIHAWHRDWFTNPTYIEDKIRNDPTEYEEFKKLHERLKKENNWNDCLCSCCKPHEENKASNIQR